MDQSGLDLPGDLERKPDSYPNTPDEEVVVAATASMDQAEPLQAFSVVAKDTETDRREEEERELQRQQEQEREFQV